MAGGDGGGNRRAYRSPLRAERARRTRGAVLAAAHELFVARGYAATTVRAVAAAAGVSVPTVEQLFGTKRALLARVVDVARAGDEDPVAVLDRAPARAAESVATAAEFLAAAAAEIAVVAARSSAVLAVLATAAAGDPEIAALARDVDAQRRAVASWLVDGVRRRAGLRVEPDRAVDAVWALLDPVVHGRLTGDRGWTGEEFADWLADALARLLVPG
jgi:AcrR family transcriptional regulator